MIWHYLECKERQPLSRWLSGMELGVTLASLWWPSGSHLLVWPVGVSPQGGVSALFGLHNDSSLLHHCTNSAGIKW